MKERWKNPPFLAMIGFSLVTLVLLVLIGRWCYTNYYLTGKLTSVQDREVAGVEMQSPEALDVKKPEFPFAEVDLTDLKKKNPDVVAWLRVSEIDLDIPIVQTTDNKFYLTHDVDKKESSLGWVFADDRSNVEYPGLNTVLYGHNAVSKKMFGSLKNLWNIDADKVSTDGLIQFTTSSKEMVYQIVSMYVTDYTDWLYVDQIFTSDADKKEFIDRLQKQNQVPAYTDPSLTINDSILTFSTCYGSAGTTQRLVVHAKLLSMKDTKVVAMH